MGFTPAPPWGDAGHPPAGTPVLPDDAAVARALQAAAEAAGETLPGRSGAPGDPAGVPAVVLAGGDLARTLGGSGEPGSAGTLRAFRLDAVVLHLDDRTLLAVAHVVLHRPRRWGGPLLGPLVALCNAEYRGAADLAPRSHPADGRLDVLDATSLAPRQRLRAWRRLPSGTHVPHPDITSRRVASWERTFARPVVVVADGRRVGRARHVAAEVAPGAFVAYR